MTMRLPSQCMGHICIALTIGLQLFTASSELYSGERGRHQSTFQAPQTSYGQDTYSPPPRKTFQSNYYRPSMFRQDSYGTPPFNPYTSPSARQFPSYKHNSYPPSRRFHKHTGYGEQYRSQKSGPFYQPRPFPRRPTGPHPDPYGNNPMPSPYHGNPNPYSRRNLPQRPTYPNPPSRPYPTPVHRPNPYPKPQPRPYPSPRPADNPYPPMPRPYPKPYHPYPYPGASNPYPPKPYPNPPIVPKPSPGPYTPTIPYIKPTPNPNPTPHPNHFPYAQPPIAPKPSGSVLPYNLCDNCRFKNGVGFNPFPEDCQAFVQCQKYGGTKLIPRKQKCPYNLFWSQEILTCVRPGNTKCPWDPCTEMKSSTVPVYGNCAAYHKCGDYHRTSAILCCDYGYKYAPDYGYNKHGPCVRASDCHDSCGPKKTHPKKEVCRLFPVPGYPTKYREIVNYREYIRPCAPGTAFIQSKCGCAIAIKVAPKGCKPAVFIDFKYGIRDVSGNWVSVGNEWNRVKSVKVPWAKDGYAGEFHESQLILWRFANAPLGPPLKIYFAFLEKPLGQGYGGKNAILVSNGDCGKDPSVEIVFDRDSRTISALVDTNYGDYNYKAAVVSVPYAPGEYKHVTYLYNGKYLTLTVNSQSSQKSKSVAVSGKVRTVHCALSLGEIKGGTPFYGLLDDFKLWLCLAHVYPPPTSAYPPSPSPYQPSRNSPFPPTASPQVPRPFPPQQNDYLYPPHNSGQYPPTNSGPYPPHNSGQYPPKNSGQYPPKNSGPYPPKNSDPYPPQTSGPYPPQTSGPYPPKNSGPYPPQKSGPYPPKNSGQYPPKNSGQYPPKNSDPYPPQTSGPYLPKNSGPYPPHNSGPYPPQTSRSYPPKHSRPYPPQTSGPYPPQKFSFQQYPPQDTDYVPYPPHKQDNQQYPPHKEDYPPFSPSKPPNPYPSPQKSDYPPKPYPSPKNYDYQYPR